jgi:hypothetical protein
MTDNMQFILSKYLSMKDFRHPLNGEAYSKSERIAIMASFLTDPFYDRKFTIDDKLMANKFIEMILNENDNGKSNSNRVD